MNELVIERANPNLCCKMLNDCMVKELYTFEIKKFEFK